MTDDPLSRALKQKNAIAKCLEPYPHRALEVEEDARFDELRSDIKKLREYDVKFWPSIFCISYYMKVVMATARKKTDAPKKTDKYMFDEGAPNPFLSEIDEDIKFDDEDIKFDEEALTPILSEIYGDINRAYENKREPIAGLPKEFLFRLYRTLFGTDLLQRNKRIKSNIDFCEELNANSGKYISPLIDFMYVELDACILKLKEISDDKEPITREFWNSIIHAILNAELVIYLFSKEDVKENKGPFSKIPFEVQEKDDPKDIKKLFRARVEDARRLFREIGKEGHFPDLNKGEKDTVFGPVNSSKLASMQFSSVTEEGADGDRRGRHSPQDESPDTNLLADADLGRLDEKIRNDEVGIIPIDPRMGLKVFADRRTGRIMGPTGEGTTAMVLFAHASNGNFRKQRHPGYAIRVPRLTSGNLFMNFENAEILYFEHLQANQLGQHDALGGAGLEHGSFTYRLTDILTQDLHLGDELETLLPQGSRPESVDAIVALNMTPGRPARIGLVCREFAWPADLQAELSSISDLPEKSFEFLSKAILRIRRDHERKMNEFPADQSKAIDMPPVFALNPAIESRESRAKLLSKLFDETSDIQRFAKDIEYTVLDREWIEKVYCKERASGWFFGLSYLRTPWLSSDFQRLLTGLVAESGAIARTEEKAYDAEIGPPTILGRLREAKLEEWFSLLEFLCEGLASIHTGGGVFDSSVHEHVHGDVRPANVMFQRDKPINQCVWIDIGVGAAHARERRISQTRRDSVFYALERIEHESEENDQIQLIDLSGRASSDPNLYIKFLYREDNTRSSANTLQLSRGKTIINGRLSSLIKGDRVLLNEDYIFEVERIDASDDRVEIGRVWRIAAGEVPIEITKREILNQMEHKTLSDYKILWRWGAASDIYGFGLMLLYVFFMRGLSLRIAADEVAGQVDPDERREVDVEEEFRNLVSVLKTGGFLEAFLQRADATSASARDFFRSRVNMKTIPEEALRYTRVDDRPQSWDGLTLETQTIVDHAWNLARESWFFAPGLRHVYAGLNNNPVLFAIFLDIVLSCLWRTEDVTRSVGVRSQEIDRGLACYCESRINAERAKGSTPAENLRADLHFISDVLRGRSGFDNPWNTAHPHVMPLSAAGTDDRQDPIQTISKLQKKIEELEERLQRRSGVEGSSESDEPRGKSWVKRTPWN